MRRSGYRLSHRSVAVRIDRCDSHLVVIVADDREDAIADDVLLISLGNEVYLVVSFLCVPVYELLTTDDQEDLLVTIVLMLENLELRICWDDMRWFVIEDLSLIHI